jgi:hypothetical protein
MGMGKPLSTGQPQLIEGSSERFRFVTDLEEVFRRKVATSREIETDFECGEHLNGLLMIPAI